MYVCRLVRRVDNFLDSSFIVVFYYDPTIAGFDSQSGYYSTTDATVNGSSPNTTSNDNKLRLIYYHTYTKGGYRVMHPFHPLDEKEEVIFDIYTSNGILSMVQPSIEVCQYFLT